jgi:lantibiotic modifying enzyme
MKSAKDFLIIALALGLAWGGTAIAQGNAGSKYLVHALEAEKFIASQKIEGDRGVYWRVAPEAEATPNYNFYHGSGGVALFYLELYAATSDQKYLDLAVSAGNEIVANAADAAGGRISMYSGLPGDVFVLNELYKATKDDRFHGAALHVIHHIKIQAKPIGDGVGWIEKNPFAAYNAANTNIGEMYDLTIGSAGVGVMFLYAYRDKLDPEGVDWSIRIADRLLEVAEKTKDGLRWPMMDNLPAPYIMPNFSHGPAGIAYFFADLYLETKLQKYLDAAISAAEYVQSRAVPKGDGVLVTHHEQPDPADLYYLSSCHGPPGTGRLMYLLNQITGETKWLDWIELNMKGMLATGAPEKRSEGLWNNHGQCCGDAGLGDYAVYLYRATGKETYLDVANRIAEYLVSDANKKDGTLSWTTAEMRIKPEFVQTQTGYMQGAAGMGSFFLHLATVKTDSVKIPILATPFK